MVFCCPLDRVTESDVSTNFPFLKKEGEILFLSLLNKSASIIPILYFMGTDSATFIKGRILKCNSSGTFDAFLYSFSKRICPPLVLISSLTTTVPPCSYSSRLSIRSEEHTSELQSRGHLVCRLLL